MQIPREKTPLNPATMAAILRDSYHGVFGTFPSLPMLANAWAQCALEHASGEATYDRNIGNITVPAGYAGDFYVLHVQEQVEPGVWKYLDLKFAAHQDFIDGGRAYWALLRRRYASVLPLFEAGRTEDAAYRLHDLHYYTANAAPYARGMVGLVRRFDREIVPQLMDRVKPEPVSVAVDGWDEIVEACAGANWCGARAA